MSTLLQFPDDRTKAQGSANSQTTALSPKRTPLRAAGPAVLGGVGGTVALSPIPSGVSYSSRCAAVALAPIPIDLLYPATDSNRRDLIEALRLLPQAVSALENARDALASGDVLQSDHHVHAVQVLLPGLFRCRTIGDGFASIVNALEIAFVNQRGEPLVGNQIVTALRILKDLRSHPFVPFDAAQQSIEELEKVGLRVDPSILGEFIDAAP